ncbi:MAG: DUF692 domain-containing protein [Alphaproteobacteria bacterium]|nr:MAG: DUF692 domain-containing protein [Alphaproteobacteria bacterium]
MHVSPRPAPAFEAGVGLKPQHYKEALEGHHPLSFFEVHAENFFGLGGPPHRWLTAFREKFDLSIHGVCLSIGAPSALDVGHLQRLKLLVDRYQPKFVSEHLAWTGDSGIFHNDLLPVPLNAASFRYICDHVDEVQSRLGRQILIENPSLYLELRESDIAEPEFLNDLAKATGCGLLLDINNVFVSATNLGFEAQAYLDKIEARHVGEIHLAGHVVDPAAKEPLLIDNHGALICDEVLALYAAFVADKGPRPTLVEWDTDVPDFAVLIGETRRACRAIEAAAFVKSEMAHG